MSEEITFILWKWVGWRQNTYQAEHVNACCRMLRDNLTIPHKIICITDEPAGITECDIYPLWEEWPTLGSTGRPNCFRRLRLFHKEFAKQFGTRLVSIDLDTIILSDISHLFTSGEPFKVLEGRHSRYSGSMWMLTPGVHQHVWDDFDPKNSPKEIIKARKTMIRETGRSKLVGSDQAWMSLKIEDAATWPIGYSSEILFISDIMPNQYIVPPQAKVIIFAGRIKPWDAECKNKSPFLYDTWMNYQNKL